MTYYEKAKDMGRGLAVECTNCNKRWNISHKTRKCGECHGLRIRFAVPNTSKTVEENGVKKDAMKVISTQCSGCKGSGTTSKINVGKCGRCFGTTWNFVTENPFIQMRTLPRSTNCPYFKQKRKKILGVDDCCQNCTKGLLYKTKCKDCGGGAEQEKCGKCHHTGITYRKLALDVVSAMKLNLERVNQVSVDDLNLCTKCHGKGTVKKCGGFLGHTTCGVCQGEGLDPANPSPPQQSTANPVVSRLHESEERGTAGVYPTAQSPFPRQPPARQTIPLSVAAAAP